MFSTSNTTEPGKVAKKHFIHLVIFSFALLYKSGVFQIPFTSGGESGMNLVAFFIYFPFLIILIFYNFIFIMLGLSMLSKINRLLIFIFPVIPVIGWFFLSAQQIQLGYWKLSSVEFWIIILLWLASNILLYYFTKQKTAERNK